MVQRHDSSPAQRAQIVCQMIAHAGDYGFVTQLSRDLGVSRQTLYTWTQQGCQALTQAFLRALHYSRKHLELDKSTRQAQDGGRK